MRAAPEIPFRKTVTTDRVFQWHRMGSKIYLCDIFNLFNYLSLSHHGKMTTVFKSEIKWLHSKPNWNYGVMSEHSEFWHDSNISGDFKRDWAKGPLSSSWFMITYLSFQKSLSITSQSQKIPKLGRNGSMTYLWISQVNQLCLCRRSTAWGHKWQ